MTKAQVVAPVVESFVHFKGTTNSPVQYLTLRGLQFKHAPVCFAPEGHADGQAAFSIPAVSWLITRARLPWKIVRSDMSALMVCGSVTPADSARGLHSSARSRRGGVRIGEAAAGDSANAQGHTGFCTVDNKHHPGGSRIFLGAIGVWIGESGTIR